MKTKRWYSCSLSTEHRSIAEFLLIKRILTEVDEFSDERYVAFAPVLQIVGIELPWQEAVKKEQRNSNLQYLAFSWSPLLQQT